MDGWRRKAFSRVPSARSLSSVPDRCGSAAKTWGEPTDCLQIVLCSRAPAVAKTIGARPRTQGGRLRAAAPGVRLPTRCTFWPESAATRHGTQPEGASRTASAQRGSGPNQFGIAGEYRFARSALSGRALNEKTTRRPPYTTVLVCEDDEQLGMLVEIILSEHGYNVLLAARAEQALELAAEHAGAIDVLVTDVELPRMSGPELVGRLQSEFPALEVLLLSGYPADSIPGRPMPDDFAFLQKPFTETSLLQKIESLVELSS